MVSVPAGIAGTPVSSHPHPHPLAVGATSAARMIGISPRSLWALSRDPRSGLRSFRVGRRVLYRVADLEAFAASRVNVDSSSAV
jgi:hypothetical protein